MWAAEAVEDTSSVWFEIIENFRFEDVNGYEEESWLKVSFAYSPKIDILESFIILFFNRNISTPVFIEGC